MLKRYGEKALEDRCARKNPPPAMLIEHPGISLSWQE